MSDTQETQQEVVDQNINQEENLEGQDGTSELENTEEIPAEVQELAAKQESGEKLTKKEQQILKKSFELKVGDKVKKIDLDLNDDEKIKHYLSKAIGADEKFEEAAKYRKQAEQLVTMLKSDPLSILKHPELGLDIKALAQKVLQEELDEAAKSPEQKAMEEKERKLKEYEEKLKAIEEEKRQAQMQKMYEEQQRNLENEIIEAIDTSSLPSSPHVVRRVADIMIAAVESGWENVSIKDVMPYAESVLLDEYQEWFSNMPGEKLERIVGKNALDGYRKSKISKQKAPVTPSQIKETATKAKPVEEKPQPKKKISDLLGF